MILASVVPGPVSAATVADPPTTTSLAATPAPATTVLTTAPSTTVAPVPLAQAEPVPSAPTAAPEAEAALVPPPGALQPPLSPPASGPESQAPGPLLPSKPAGVSRGGGPDSAELLRLLQDSAARRGLLDGRVTELETAIVRLEAEEQASDAALEVSQADQARASAQLAATGADLRRAQETVWQALFPAPDRNPPTTAEGVRPAGLGRSPMDGSAVARVSAQPSVDPGPSSPPVATATALRVERQLKAQAEAQTQELMDARARTSDARRAAATAWQTLETERQTLGTLRRELSAALLDPESFAQGGALAPGVAPSSRALAEIPADYLALYQEAEKRCPGLSWTVLAAIGSIESSHGRSPAAGVHSGANFAGAMGPMQFLGPTWSTYGVDGNKDGRRDVYNPTDAIFGAAHYLCASGAGDPGRLPDAIWAYNHADWYVDDVLVKAFRYGVGGLEADAAADVGKLLASPNLTLTARARADLVNGVVDPRVVRLLTAAVAEHRISVSVFQTGHTQFVAGTDRVSNHFHGRAVDIYAVDGAPVSPSNDAALELSLAILTGSPILQPDEFGSPWAGLSKFPGAFSDAGHQNHLHIAWSS